VKDEIRLTLRGLQDKAVGELEAAKREHRKALQVRTTFAVMLRVFVVLRLCDCVDSILQDRLWRLLDVPLHGLRGYNAAH
jgi:hypothetical protein